MDKHQNIITDNYALYLGDCCQIMPKIPNESIHYSIFSPPFSSLYSYTDNPADMSNNKNYHQFFQHFDFLIEQLMRVMIPGRIVSVHCMDLPSFKKDGDPIGLVDFPGDIIQHFQKIGFIFHSRHCIWKDPLIAAVRTKSIGLAHKQIIKDSSMCRTGIPDYIISFRKPGENPKPIEHPNGFSTYFGSRSIPNSLYRQFSKHTGEQRKNKLSHWIWQQYASPVWFDIRQTKILKHKMAKAQKDEKHICPLQLDTIERCIALWSGKDDVVLSPFMGIGSEIYVAIKNNRKGIGIELKTSYFKQAIRNLKHVEKQKQRQTLKD